MAIVKMDKFTLLTFQRHKSGLLKELQKFGDIHFKKPRGEDMEQLKADISPERISALESELENVRFAIAKIAPFAEKPKGLKALTTPAPAMSFEEFDAYLERYDYRETAQAAKELDDRANAVKSEISKLGSESDGLAQWLRLDAAPADLASLKEATALLGTVNKAAAESFRQTVEAAFTDAYIELLGTGKDDMAMLVIMPTEGFEERFERLKELGFSRAALTTRDIPERAVAKNAERVRELEGELAEIAKKTAALAVDLQKLQIAADCLNNGLERERARENFLTTESVVVLDGWFPTEKAATIKRLLEKSCGKEYYLESAPAEKDDPENPVKLTNNRLVRAFEDVTTMYATPRYNEIDPTPLFMPFYWLCFGLMVGDIGFGLVLLVGTFIGVKYLNFKAGMKKFMMFFHYCSYGVIAAGCAYSSFFGFSFWKPLLDTQADIPLMLILAVALGVVQVVFGLLIKGYLLIREGHPLDALFDSVFWIVTLLGGIAWLVGVAGAIPASAGNIGKWCFTGGVIGLALTQGRGAASIGGKIGTSLWEVYGLSSYVGDLVSYTRIVALGLSGAFIGFSFIQISSIIGPGVLGTLLKIIIITIGQALNFGLGLLGAYVHTSRLQYVEFFGKYFEGGGVPFKPFKAKNDYIVINEGGK